MASNWRIAEPNWNPCVHSVQPWATYRPSTVKTGVPDSGPQVSPIERIFRPESSHIRSIAASKSGGVRSLSIESMRFSASSRQEFATLRRDEVQSTQLAPKLQLGNTPPRSSASHVPHPNSTSHCRGAWPQPQRGPCGRVRMTVYGTQGGSGASKKPVSHALRYISVPTSATDSNRANERVRDTFIRKWRRSNSATDTMCFLPACRASRPTAPPPGVGFLAWRRRRAKTVSDRRPKHISPLAASAAAEVSSTSCTASPRSAARSSFSGTLEKASATLQN